MENYCHVWVGAPTYFVELLDKLQKWISFQGGLLVILIDCMIFMSQFLDLTRMSMSTVSFLTQLEYGTPSL